MTRLGDQNQVLDPHATGSDTIEPGLDGHHVTYGQNRLGSPAEEGLLMDVEPDPVARPVGEQVGEALLSEDLSARGVDITGARSGSDRIKSGLLGPREDPIPTLLFLGRLTDDEGSSHVGVVAVEQRPTSMTTVSPSTSILDVGR